MLIYQVTALLDLLEKKRSEAYQEFLGCLEHLYPHLYLTVLEGGETGENEAEVCHPPPEIWFTLSDNFAGLIFEPCDVHDCSFLLSPPVWHGINSKDVCNISCYIL